MSKATVTLSSYNMGPDATESDFDAWTSYVSSHIDDVAGCEVAAVEQHRFGDSARDSVTGLDDDKREAVLSWLSHEGWDDFCAEPAVVTAGVSDMSWTYEQYWNVVLGANRSALGVVREFELTGAGLDEWLGTAEEAAASAGGLDPANLPPTWPLHHARALKALRDVAEHKNCIECGETATAERVVADLVVHLCAEHAAEVDADE